MGVSISKLAHGVWYYAPSILQPLCEWLFGFSETSSRRDFRTTLMVSIVRALFNDPTRISMLEEQRASFSKGRPDASLWIYGEVFPVSKDNNLAELVAGAIQQLSHEITTLSEVPAESVSGEWIGHKKKEAATSPSEEQIFSSLVQDLHSDIVMIYLHGGQFYLRDAASRRDIAHELTRRTGGRCFSVSYRLSPQHTFPAPILDLLVVYLSLLYPSSNGHHTTVSPSNICICGDSSGANIAVAFLQLIIQLNKQAPPDRPVVLWNGRYVELPYPRAISTHSGYFDLSRSLPSEKNNIDFDIIPPAAKPPAPQSRYLPDSIWPPLQPRHHVYTPDILLTHPLVSPVTARDWKNCSTKVWLSVGQECLADGSIILAKTMAEGGIDVTLEMYEGMPHDFLVLLRSSKCGQECLRRWAEFLEFACLNNVASAERVGFSTAWVREPNGSWRAETIKDLEPQLSREDLLQGMEAQIQAWGEPWIV